MSLKVVELSAVAPDGDLGAAGTHLGCVSVTWPPQQTTTGGGLSHRNLFPQFWRLEVQNRGVGRSGFLWATLLGSQLAAFSLHPLCAHVPGASVCPDLLFVEGQPLRGIRAHLPASC